MMLSAAQASDDAIEQTWRAIEEGARTTLVDSPPGAGKSTLVRSISSRLCREMQIPIVVQTNNQADDMVRGFIGSGILVGRLHGSKYVPPSDLQSSEDIISNKSIHALSDCQIIVAPAAKWGTIDVQHQWEFGIIDEAYQMRSDALLPIGKLMQRLLLVGDPGQLDPFTTADPSLFRGTPLSPIETAAATILTTYPDTSRIDLPVSWRLPHSAAKVVSSAFYKTPFTSGTGPNDRRMELSVPTIHPSRTKSAIEKSSADGWAFLELEDLLMPSNDFEMIDTIVQLIDGMLASNIILHDEKGTRPLLPRDIAVGVTHNDQKDHLRKSVADRVNRKWSLRDDEISIDTANKLQGREYESVIVWHPLSGRRDASVFHLDAGRLCVLASRHRHSCIVVSRGGIADQLNAYPASEPVWLGEQTPTMDGWHAHLKMLDHLDNFKV